PQYPDIANAQQPVADAVLDFLEVRIGEHEFLAGPRPTIADCTLFVGVDVFHHLFDFELPARCPRLRRWFERFGKRPSAQVK
ncbi:MAG: glutathione S-transferase family protein, partial [Steroidobacteraceae bacterium]